jgi:HEPN domain-containing protein
MHLQRSKLVVAVALALPLATAACNRRAAEESLEAAEQRLEAVRAELEQRAPGELAALSRDLDEARDDLEAGRYTRALRTTQRIPARIRAAQDAAAGRRPARPPVSGPS